MIINLKLLSLLTVQRCDSFKRYKMDNKRKVMDNFPSNFNDYYLSKNEDSFGNFILGLYRCEKQF